MLLTLQLSMKVIFLFTLFLFGATLRAQDFTCYRLYTIEEFALAHFQDSIEFYRVFHEVVKYSAIARENGLEGVFDVQLINHSDSSFEIHINNTKQQLLKTSIIEAISKTQHIWLHKEIPFIVNFCIEYKLISPKEKTHAYTSSCKLKEIAYRVHELRDSSYLYKGFEVTYKPQIAGYPQFRHLKNPKKYRPIESIEKLLEEAIKSCCKKSIQLTYLEPVRPHSQSLYTTPPGYIGVNFNSKGYISNVYVYGNLTKKIDATALTQMLQGIKFLPALAGTKPVNVRLEYRSH